MRVTHCPVNTAGIPWANYSASYIQQGYIWSAYDAIRHVRETNEWQQHVFATERADSIFEGMLHVLQFDAGDLRYALVKHLGTLPDLPASPWRSAR